MTLSVAHDYLRQRIRFNCLRPARARKILIENVLEKYKPPGKKQKFKPFSASQPTDQMVTPEELAALAVFIISKVGAFIAGVAYDVDGGHVFALVEQS